ncbi:M23 family metallopeptidase [Desulfitibacter alkalitolerans]|uniref:M23 family metallopeptidase n=1 Tax=Desulfitibacter alkalitolerans TaxID=264641 RepID=UPI000489F769|nr:M23 family metallopeptidase [Desulfitibacter alkalitolerans]
MGTSKSKLKKKRYFTIMLIPHSQKKINQFKIPIWALACIITLFTVITCSLVYFAVDFKAAKEDLDRLKHVETVNQVQAKKIADLIEKTRNMESKIADIELLDRQVRELVGLESDEEKEIQLQDYHSPISMQPEFSLAMIPRGGVSRGQVSRLYESNMDLLEMLDKDLTMLDQIVEMKEEGLAQLQVEVSDQLKYLAAKPDRLPVNGRITSKYGYRSSPFGAGRREFHDGIDIAAAHGTYIRAAGDGRVIFSGWVPGYGRMVSISHGYGYVSHYAHNSVNLVKVGQTVKKGDRVARVGTSGRSTGPHVHFMIDQNGKRINPQNVLK